MHHIVPPPPFLVLGAEPSRKIKQKTVEFSNQTRTYIVRIILAFLPLVIILTLYIRLLIQISKMSPTSGSQGSPHGLFLLRENLPSFLFDHNVARSFQAYSQIQ